MFLRTTDEMLKEFDYLGPTKAEEVVITNTNKIADMIENISPIHPDKCPPEIENSDVMLREICYKKAHEMYGENLPKIVEERLEKELNSIIGNGYAVMYIMAQKLVWKSNEDGYLVGSRGSVGSSFVATIVRSVSIQILIQRKFESRPEVVDLTFRIRSVLYVEISLQRTALTFRLKHSLDSREIRNLISTLTSLVIIRQMHMPTLK